MKGFCPSFVTVRRQAEAGHGHYRLHDPVLLPQPTLPAIGQTYDIT